MIDSRFPQSFGAYTLLESLGRGGMAEVFLAGYEAMPGARRLVALKQVLPGLAGDPTFRAMFLDEARVLTNLYHPNLDHIVDVGEVDGVPFLALDYVPGRDLLQVLHRQESEAHLPPALGVHIATKVLAGLSHAHGRSGNAGRSLGIVHRDVSPENIILAFDGAVKLCDFGIARGEMRAVVTEPGFIKGKPSYMAPEQILAKAIDPRADIFAVGVLLYRLTVGRHPFRVSGNDEETFRKIVQDMPPPPHLVRPGLPDALSLVILKALAKAPRERFESADAFLMALEEVMARERWVGGERQLRTRMTELFPGAAKAALRLAIQPLNLEAAREASHYLSSADVELLDTPTNMKRLQLDQRLTPDSPDSPDSIDDALAQRVDDPADLTPTETHTASISEAATHPGETLDPPTLSGRTVLPPPAPKAKRAPIDHRDARLLPFEESEPATQFDGRYAEDGKSTNSDKGPAAGPPTNRSEKIDSIYDDSNSEISTRISRFPPGYDPEGDPSGEGSLNDPSLLERQGGAALASPPRGSGGSHSIKPTRPHAPRRPLADWRDDLGETLQRRYRGVPFSALAGGGLFFLLLLALVWKAAVCN